MSLGEAVGAIQDIVRALQSLGVEYRIGGSVASSALGRFRATNDVDIVADLGPQHAAAFVRAIEGKFYLDDEYVREALSGRRSFNLIHLQSMVKVDLFPVRDRAYDRAAFLRQLSGTLDPQTSFEAALFTPEDVILGKIEWFEMGGRVSERQWADILGVLQVQPVLDLAYLRHWAAELGLSGLLEQGLLEAGYPPL